MTDFSDPAVSGQALSSGHMAHHEGLAKAVAQVKALTRQVNVLIRIVGRDLLSTDGT